MWYATMFKPNQSFVYLDQFSVITLVEPHCPHALLELDFGKSHQLDLPFQR